MMVSSLLRQAFSNIAPMVSLRRFASVAVLVFLQACLPVARAGDALDYLPEDSLGFAVVRNLNSFNAKAEQLTKLFELPLPSPLTFVQFATGLSEGLDLEGDLLLAVLPGPNPSEPEPMVLLPIADYAKFAASVKGDESGEVCRVTVAGEEVLIAKQGSYALLMNVEHRETLELMMGLEPAPVAVLESLGPWIASNDVTVALMPAGAKMLLELGRQGLEAQERQFADQLADPQFEQIAKQMEKNLLVSRWFLEFLGAELKMGAVGLAIDDENNVRLGKRVLLSETGILGKTEQVAVGVTSPFSGFADQAYVVAGGGPIPESWGKTLAAVSRRIMEKMPEAYGLEELEEEKWNELEAMYREMMQGLNFSSMILLPGEEGEPLFSNIFGIAKVADANGYLDSYQKAMETWNGIMAETTGDIKFEYEVMPTTVGEAKAIEVVVDVAAAAQAPNVPTFNWMLESMFGEDGKFRQLMVAADQKTLVYGMAEKDRLTAVIDDAKKGETGLSETAELQTTMKLLPAVAPWRMAVSPRGCVQWATRFVNEFMVHLQGQTIDIPEFDVCPPIGFSMNLVDARMEFDMVWSVETLKALADYIKKVQAM